MNLGPRPAPIEFDYDDLWIGSREPSTLTQCELQEALRSQVEKCVLLLNDKTLSDSSEIALFNEDVSYENRFIEPFRFLSHIGKEIFSLSAEGTDIPDQDYESPEVWQLPEGSATLNNDRDVHDSIFTSEIQQEPDVVTVQTFSTNSTGLAGPLRKLSKRDTSRQMPLNLVVNLENSRLLKVVSSLVDKVQSTGIVKDDLQNSELPEPASLVRGQTRPTITIKGHLLGCYREIRFVPRANEFMRNSRLQQAIRQSIADLKIDCLHYWSLVLSVALTTVRAIITLVWCHYRVHAPYSLFDSCGRRNVIQEKSLVSFHSWFEPFEFILLRV